MTEEKKIKLSSGIPGVIKTAAVIDGQKVTFRHRVLLGSARQSPNTDIIGSFELQNGTAFSQSCPHPHPLQQNIFQYFVAALNCNHESLDEKQSEATFASPSRFFNLDKRLLFDIAINKRQTSGNPLQPFGQTWEMPYNSEDECHKIYEGLKYSLFESCAFDGLNRSRNRIFFSNDVILKDALVWFQIHSLLWELKQQADPQGPIIFEFYDDRYAVDNRYPHDNCGIDTIYYFFEKFPWLLSKKVMLKCYKYCDNEESSEPTLVKPKVVLGTGNKLPSDRAAALENITSMFVKFGGYVQNREKYENEIATRSADFPVEMENINVTVVHSFDYDHCIAGSRFKKLFLEYRQPSDSEQDITKIKKQIATKAFRETHPRLLKHLHDYDYSKDLRLLHSGKQYVSCLGLRFGSPISKHQNATIGNVHLPDKNDAAKNTVQDRCGIL